LTSYHLRRRLGIQCHTRLKIDIFDDEIHHYFNVGHHQRLRGNTPKIDRSSMSDRLKDKVALVTGANSGIGRAIAKRFAAEGAQVVLTGPREPELKAAADEIGEAALAVRADSSRLEDLDSLFTVITGRYGRLDIVVPNAGVGWLTPLGQITEEDYESIFGTNVKGTIFTVQKALPLLNAGASVVLNGSSASAMGAQAFSVYGATKAALRSLVRHWTVDLRGTGIRVNIVSPGPVETPALLGLGQPGQEQQTLESFSQTVPLGRVADPDEIARVFAFMASEESGYVHGAELFVDGDQAQV
jgi:NAD(P)-dependent dehydrogenase (short-subunit alcohol dehydrogenase family)